MAPLVMWRFRAKKEEEREERGRRSKAYIKCPKGAAIASGRDGRCKGRSERSPEVIGRY